MLEFEKELKRAKEYSINFKEYIDSLPLFSPKKMYDRLTDEGYYGQEGARKSVCLMAYRHIKRLKDIYLYDIPREELPPKSNYLLVGATGCGKTYLVELLFKHILHIPTAIIDITTFSETGYVGQDVSSILTRLLYAANMEVQKAAIGVICIDEFDKIATGMNNAVFSGAGTTKDVTGLGVQRELLKMLESSEVVVPLNFSQSTYGERIILSTADIGFIGSGAFSGLKLMLNETGKTANIGFGKDPKGFIKDDIAVDYDIEEVENTAHFQKYGFLPELIGRFTRIVPFKALSHDILKEILSKNIVDKYQNEFNNEGIHLKVDPGVMDLIVEDCIKKQTGARGLNSVITRYLEEVAFESFGNKKVKNVRLRKLKNKIKIDVK